MHNKAQAKKPAKNSTYYADKENAASNLAWERPGEGEISEHDEKWMKAGHAAVESGIDPEIVSEWVVDCMAARRFYIFTHPEMASIIDARAGLMQADYQACLDDPRFSGDEDA